MWSARVPRGFAVVPPRIAYPAGSSGPSGDEAQPVPGFRRTRLCSQDEAAGEDPVCVTMPTPSARRGMPKVVPGYRCWRMKRSRWLRDAAVRVTTTFWGMG
jgi:hypothetical protein